MMCLLLGATLLSSATEANHHLVSVTAEHDMKSSETICKEMLEHTV